MSKTKKTTLKKKKDFFLKGAKDYYTNNPTGDFPPQLILVDEEDDLMMSLQIDGEKKDELLETLGVALSVASMQYKKFPKVESLLLCTPVWYLKSSTEDVNVIQPSESPDKKEAVFLSSLDKKGKNGFEMYEVERKFDGNNIEAKMVPVFEDELKKKKNTKIEDNVLTKFWVPYKNMQDSWGDLEDREKNVLSMMAANILEKFLELSEKK